MSNNLRVKFLILGAGPTGLGAAYQLQKQGINDFLVLEKNPFPGGLAASVTDDKGFVWDLGGHVHFSHYKYYDQACDEALGLDGWFSHERNSQIWFYDRFVPYPFQANLHYLPFFERAHCLWSITREKWQSSKIVSNFSEWLISGFGRRIYEIFLKPYNEKVWAHSLDQMGASWVGERVAQPNLFKLWKNSLLGIDEKTWGPNNYFRFPKQGGTGALWSAMAKRIGDKFFRFNTDISSLNLKNKNLIDANLNQITFDYLISTIPLPILIERSNALSEETRKASQRLKFTKTVLMGIGLKGKPPEKIRKIGWMYFPDPRVPFYRATILSNYSSYVVPEPGNQWSLLLECAHTEHSQVDTNEIIDVSLKFLHEVNFIANPTDVLSVWSKVLPYGYPVPYVNRDNDLSLIHNELEPYNVFSRGRFGGWKYEVSNQDHSFMQGVEIIDRLVSKKPESIYSVSAR